MPEVFETQAHQFLLGEFLWALKSKSSPLCYEVCDFFIFLLLALDQFQNACLPLVIVELSEKFVFHRLPIKMDPSERFTYQLNIAPYNDCTKRCKKGASRTIG